MHARGWHKNVVFMYLQCKRVLCTEARARTLRVGSNEKAMTSCIVSCSMTAYHEYEHTARQQICLTL